LTTRIQRRSRKQEAAGAERFGGRVVPGSGSGWAVKNDVKTDDLSLEYKFTEKKSYSLRYDDLVKAERQALLDSGRDFAFVVELGGREWVITSREYFEGLYRGNPE
jgi:hypothetical protein